MFDLQCFADSSRISLQARDESEADNTVSVRGSARPALDDQSGWLTVKFLGGSDALFISLAIALVIFGGINASAIAGGVWFRRPKPSAAVLTQPS